MKDQIKYAIVILITVFCLIGALLLTALIPKQAIHDNMLESAQEMVEHKPFERKIENMDSTIMHYYADAISLNIIYHLDEKDPIKSVVESGYYKTNTPYSEAYDLLESIEEDKEANTEYARYWHGNIVIIKPLLLIMTVGQIHCALFVLFLVLVGVLFFQLSRRNGIGEIITLSIAMLMTLTFLTPFVFEYIWMILLMLIYSIIGLHLYKKGNKKALICMFAVDGITAAFFDFLTIETVTILVPLILVLIQIHKNKRFDKDDVIFTIKSVIGWGFGFVFMWALKWLFVSGVLHLSINQFLLGHIKTRSIGIGGAGQLTNIKEAIINNFKMLLPFDIPNFGILLGIILIIAFLYFLYVYRKNDWDKTYVVTLLIMALIPYARYIVMSEHSSGHYFFTYRAQFSTLLALGAVFIEMIEQNLFRKGNKK